MEKGASTTQSEEVDYKHLEGEFEKVIISLNPNVDRKELKSVFTEFTTRYSQPHRKHHSLIHIDELLSIARYLSESIDDYETIVLAIWGHDLEYDTQAAKGENERISAADSGNLYARLGVPVDRLQKVKSYILATENHDADETDRDLLLFLDMDMAILAADWERYLHYARSIREEYWWVEPKAYIAGRSDFLATTLQKIVFRTVVFAPLLEQSARANMRRELKLLQEGGLL